MHLADWTTFKSVCITTKSLPLQFEEWDDRVRIVGPDTNGINWEITLQKLLADGVTPNPDYTDFITSYKASCNARITQLDSDGAMMSRVKVAPAGWNYQMRMFQFETSTLGSVVNNDSDGNALTDATLKLYDANGTLITDPAEQINCVKTILDVEPPYDYYIANGQMKMYEDVTQDVYVHFIGVPDVPTQSGGNKKFVQNVNLRFIKAQSIEAGAPQAAKFLAYNATYHTNKIRVLMTHPAGYQLHIGAFLELYKA